MTPVTYFLAGARVGLRPLRTADADGPYAEWLNDAEVCQYNSHHVYPYGREQALAYIEAVRGSRSELVLAIEDRTERTHVGNIALSSIHPLYRTAEISFLIGARTHWGKGIGHEAGRLLMTHGFDALGLHRIGCGTTGDNLGMQRLAAKLGMREEGRRRQAVWKSGKWLDVVEYGVLASEWIR
jgi:ribosomal-protein-alanine N-acetyltransferase